MCVCVSATSAHVYAVVVGRVVAIKAMMITSEDFQRADWDVNCFMQYVNEFNPESDSPIMLSDPGREENVSGTQSCQNIAGSCWTTVQLLP